MRIEILKVVCATARHRAKYLAEEASFMKETASSEELIELAEKKAKYWDKKAEKLEYELSVLLMDN